MRTTEGFVSGHIEQPRVGYIDPKTLQVVPPPPLRGVAMLMCWNQ